MKDLTQFEPKYRTLVGYLRQDEPKTLSNILADVSTRINISTDAIKSRSRKREIVEARHIYCHRAYRLTKERVEDIGAFIGRDHSTVSTGISNVDNIPSLKAKYKECFGMDSIYKPIEVFEDGKLIDTFKSIKDASIAFRLSRAAIRSCLNGKIKCVWKYTFRYAE